MQFTQGFNPSTAILSQFEQDIQNNAAWAAGVQISNAAANVGFGLLNNAAASGKTARIRRISFYSVTAQVMTIGYGANSTPGVVTAYKLGLGTAGGNVVTVQNGTAASQASNVIEYVDVPAATWITSTLEPYAYLPSSSALYVVSTVVNVAIAINFVWTEH